MSIKDWCEIPALFSNYMAVTSWPDIVQISFGESFGERSANYHTSVVLGKRDVIKLIELLEEVVNVNGKDDTK